MSYNTFVCDVADWCCVYSTVRPLRNLFPFFPVSPPCVSMLTKASAVIGPAWVFLVAEGLLHESDSRRFASSFVIVASGVVATLDGDKQPFYPSSFPV